MEPTRKNGWVYDRMVEAYAARPDYPSALIERLCELAGPAPARIADIGAGLGHLSLPLAARGYRVRAVEPARGMLRALEARAQSAGVNIEVVHAAAESLPLTAADSDLVLVADALHFLDARRAGHELARVLTRSGALAFVHVQFGDSPYMQALSRVMQDAAPRRPRPHEGPRTQVAALAHVALTVHERFEVRSELSHAQLDQLLGSISYIGPAMNAARSADFRARVHALAEAPVWHTELWLHAGRRGSKSRQLGRE